MFVGICCLLGECIDFGLRRVPTSKFGAFNTVVNGKANARIVINGSSRALCHYDPAVIEEVTGKTAFNIGMNALRIDLQLAVLKTYLKHNQKPDLVIQNLDLFSFQITGPGEIYDPGRFLPYLNEPDLYSTLVTIDPQVRKWRMIPMYGYAVEDTHFTWAWGLLSVLGVHRTENYYRGYQPRAGTWTKEFEQFKSVHQSGFTYAIDPHGRRCLEEVLTLCKSQDIPVLLVLSPEYVEMQALELNRPEIIREFQLLAGKHGANFLDYSDSPISLDKRFFNNSQHMNRVGAEEFTRDLAGRLTNGMLRARL